MDFAAYHWNAFLNTTQIVRDQPISVGGLPLTLGDIDAVWNPGDAAGNNYMLFDNYFVIAEPGRAHDLGQDLVAPACELDSRLRREMPFCSANKMSSAFFWNRIFFRFLSFFSANPACRCSGIHSRSLAFISD